MSGNHFVFSRFYEDPNLNEEERSRFDDKFEREKYNVKKKHEVRQEIESRILGCGAACLLDDDEKEHEVPLQQKVKTVFGLPPFVFAKPF